MPRKRTKDKEIAGSGSKTRNNSWNPPFARVKLEDLSSKDVIIGVMGQTGSGKSSFIELASGINGIAASGLKSCTDDISVVKFFVPELLDSEICLVDTPSFDDTNKSNVDILRVVSDWLNDLYKRDILLAGLLYFHRITDNRMAGTPLMNLRLFEKICGKEFSTIVLTTTMWDDVDLETGEQREQELRDIYWKSMIDRGSTVKRFLYTRRSAFDVLRPILTRVNETHALRLQKEVTDLGLKLKDTAAGRILALQLEDLIPKQQNLLEAIRNDLMESNLRPDHLEKLQQDYQEVSARLQRVMKDAERMKISIGDQFLSFVRIKDWKGSSVFQSKKMKHRQRKVTLLMDQPLANTRAEEIATGDQADRPAQPNDLGTSTLRPRLRSRATLLRPRATLLPPTAMDQTLTSTNKIGVGEIVAGDSTYERAGGDAETVLDKELEAAIADPIGEGTRPLPKPAERPAQPNDVGTSSLRQAESQVGIHPKALQEEEKTFLARIGNALTSFESRVSPWLQPSEWLKANKSDIHSAVHDIDALTPICNLETVVFEQAMIHERLIIYIFLRLTFSADIQCSLDDFEKTLRKWQSYSTTNLLRNHRTIKNALIRLLGNASQRIDMFSGESTLQKLFILDSMALSAVLEAQITDQNRYEELVDTMGPGAHDLVNLLDARLDLPTNPALKRLYIKALRHLTEKSGFYPMTLTLAEVKPERGRRAGGGYGDVYKGQCFGEEVALKVLRLPLPSGIDTLNAWTSLEGPAQEHVSREVLIWRRLSHPNILPFYGVHFLDMNVETRICFVCPWMENGNVVEFLYRRRMASETDTIDCVALAIDIAEGLKYLHSENIIHRDLKGYNILISRSMRACIADFGLSTITDSGSATTMNGSTMMGSLRWLAPELFPDPENFPDAPGSRRHTYATDIYAFGLVCYEMFSGKLPFEVEDDFSSLVRQGERPSLPSDESSRLRGLTPEMTDLIQDCWAQDPMNRPSAERVVERLCRQPADESPLDEIGASFYAKMRQKQEDNPFFAVFMRQLP